MKYLIVILVAVMFWMLSNFGETEERKATIKPTKTVKKRTRRKTSRAKTTKKKTKI
tara:strand:- start:322 stop:489 length:168 start_codon:yes stop_codon:yes gene_type:complete